MTTWDLASVQTLVVLLVYFLMLTLFLRGRLGAWHPVTLYPGYWAVILLLPSAVDLGIDAPSPPALAIVAVGVTALAVGAVCAQAWVPRRELVAAPTYPVNLVLALSGLAGLFLVGHASFRTGIESATGTSFDELDSVTVRYAQNYLEGSSGGPLTVFFGLGAIVLALLLWAGRRFSRLFYLPMLVVAAAIVDSPARTYTLSVAAACVAFACYLRATSTGGARMRPARLLGAALLIGGAAMAYFLSVGQSLNKGQSLHRVSGGGWLPDPVRELILYFSGGVVALSNALAANEDPSALGGGRSLAGLIRLVSLIDPGVRRVETIAPVSYIPVPFNLYTAPGDVWFDLGWVGLIALFFLFGLALGVAHARAVTGDPGAMFVGAVLIASLAATPLNLNLFAVQNMMVLVVGWLVFRGLSWSPFAAAGRGRSR